MYRNLQAKVESTGSHAPLFVGADRTLREVASVMWEHDVGSLLVGEPRHPLGIISERDVVAQVARGADADRVTAGHVMTPYVVTAREGDPLSEAALKMLEEGIRHLPVVDDGGHITGVLSERDLMRPLLLDALASPQ